MGTDMELSLFQRVRKFALYNFFARCPIKVVFFGRRQTFMDKPSKDPIIIACPFF